ncbi:hypothetical protein ACNVED_15125 (plasmid) [Legionella sp. D16C41]|uniref:hypothetical protein n=1 Tax=Legionella sp. D16C41 TaxID=3402688 RepID=UPI003AF461CD
MFTIKFPKNSLIVKIKVNGPFVSIYVPAEAVENFQNNYENLLNNYSTLSMGEGPLHDFAHAAHNKHLSNFFKKSSHQHFHFLLPKTASESNLATFLNFLDDKDLSKEQKQQVLEKFRESNKINLESLLSKIKAYHYLLHSLDMREAESLKRMPLFTEFIDKLTPYLREDLANPAHISLTSMITIGHQSVSTLKAYDNLISFFTHVKLLLNFQTILEKLPKDREIAADASIITELNELFNSASKAPLPNFSKLSPALHKELKRQFPFIDENFHSLYEMLKQQLVDLLKTDELIFMLPTNHSCEVGSTSENLKQVEALQKTSQAEEIHDADIEQEINSDRMGNFKT